MNRCDYCKCSSDQLVVVKVESESCINDSTKIKIENLFDSHFCNKCVDDFIDRVGYDVRPNDRKFRRNLMQGKFGELILESLLNHYNYSTFPYGYENILRNVGSNLSRNNSVNAKRLRSSPDLIVNDRYKNEIEFIEVKTTNVAPDKYAIESAKFNSYRDFWGNSILVVIEISNLAIYASRISEIKIDEKKSTKSKIFIDFSSNFKPINKYFPNISDEELSAFIEDSKNVLRLYSQH